MLEELLKRVERGGVRSLAELGRELNISQEMLGGMIEHLARMGYLHSIEQCSQAQCAGCPVTDGCAAHGSGRLWVVKEKGG